MTIKELEVRCSLDRATIRFYEKEGLIAPSRLANGYRDYSEADALAMDKIVLLRQMDFSLEDIRAIQRGEVPLGVALERQQESLRTWRQQADRALAIAAAIRKDGASYQTLQPMKYRAYLPVVTLPLRPALPEGEYPAHGYRCRRAAARLLDQLLYFLPFCALFFWLLPLKMDEESRFLSAWLLSLLAMPVIEPLLLSTWGYTPGKWLMGLCLRPMGEEGKPAFWESFRRCWHILWSGFGLFTVPFLYICIYRCWQRGDKEEPQPWDEYGFDYTLADRKEWQEHLLVTVLAAAIALCLWLGDRIMA